MKSWMLFSLLVVVGLIAVVGLVAAIGVALPRGHVATRSASYRRPPEVVFATITDFAHSAEWRHDLKRVELIDAGSKTRRFREYGGHGAITMEAIEVTPPRRLVVRIADTGLPFGGRWIYEVEPQAGGSRLTITEEGEVYNPLFRFVARFVVGHHATLDNYLRALGRKFGEQVVPA